VEGEAVRIQVIGERGWQFRLGGQGWKKSIHGADAALMPADDELLEDTRRLQRHFELEILGVDYLAARDGQTYLLEVNHIPSVTAFEEVRQAYLDEVAAWVSRVA
jgi:glutathione synthase/RimK-type ligase-like ATP-grasp enzyme